MHVDERTEWMRIIRNKSDCSVQSSRKHELNEDIVKKKRPIATARDVECVYLARMIAQFFTRVAF